MSVGISLELVEVGDRWTGVLSEYYVISVSADKVGLFSTQTGSRMVIPINMGFRRVYLRG